MSTSWEAIVVLGILFVTLLLMAFELVPVDLAMLAATFLFVPIGIISLDEATVGFANTGMLTVMALFAVAAGVEKTGCLDWVQYLFKRKSNTDTPAIPFLLLRLFIPVGIVSAFLNNTPVVAMFIPIILDFCKTTNISPSKLLLPMSYAAILGGTCTLIGTSTNLVAYTLALKTRPEEIRAGNFGIFSLGAVGLPAFLIGLLYVTHFANVVLPDRKGAVRGDEDEDEVGEREYVVVVRVEGGTGMEGRTVGEVGLEDLKGCELVRIERGDGGVCDVDAEVVLNVGDELHYVGGPDVVMRLRNTKGLQISTGEDVDLDLKKTTGVIYEATVGHRSDLIGKRMIDVEVHKFGTKYGGAVIVAVNRRDESVDPPVAAIIMEADDVLLILADASFLALASRGDPADFAAVTETRGGNPDIDSNSNANANANANAPRSASASARRKWKSLVAAVTTIAMIVVSTAEWADLLTCAVFAVAVMLSCKCLTPREVRAALSWEVAITIAVSFGLGSAMQNSGAARIVADLLVAAATPAGELGLMICIYVGTVLLNAILSNNAAVAVVFPIVDAATRSKGYPFLPYLYLVMMAGSADFSTPIGYQCNLMVYAPGGYKFLDYIRFGVPLQLLTGVVTVGVCYDLEHWWIWVLVLACLNVLAATVVTADGRRKLEKMVRGVVGWKKKKRRKGVEKRDVDSDTDVDLDVDVDGDGDGDGDVEKGFGGREKSSRGCEAWGR